jgi:hypothetical protein
VYESLNSAAAAAIFGDGAAPYQQPLAEVLSTESGVQYRFEATAAYMGKGLDDLRGGSSVVRATAIAVPRLSPKGRPSVYLRAFHRAMRRVARDADKAEEITILAASSRTAWDY